MIKVRTMIVGPIQACCYIVNFPPSGDVLVVDPGGDGDQIVQYLKRHKLTPKYIVNTHGHIDHIGANTEVKESFPETVLCIHSADASMLGSATKNLSSELGYSFTSPEPDQLLEENDTLTLDGHQFKVLHIPGHTGGGIVLFYQSPDDKHPSVIFAGDTLFQAGIGRTDFPGGSHQNLISGIKEKIFTLPDDTVVYPGHGMTTTVGKEKQMNPFF